MMPKKCVGCGREGTYICKDCEIFLSEVDMIEVGPQSRIMSAWEYEGLMEKLIQKVKDGGCYDIIKELVEKVFEKIDLKLAVDTMITFVPMFKKKEKQRGFNQAELIARKVGEMTDRPVIKLLEKIKDDRLRAGFGLPERVENVRDVFQFQTKLNLIQVPSNVLLVDDFYTTGATINECVRILKRGGVKRVYGFTLARKISS